MNYLILKCSKTQYNYNDSHTFMAKRIKFYISVKTDAATRFAPLLNANGDVRYFESHEAAKAAAKKWQQAA